MGGEAGDDELEPAAALEELLEEVADGLGLDVEVEVQEEDGVLRAPCGARTSVCSSAAAVRRSTLFSTWPSGSCSARVPLLFVW